MKLFELDWGNFIERLAVWRMLSLKAKLAFAEIRPDRGVRVAAFDGGETLLAKYGLVDVYEKGTMVRVARDGREFSRGIRAMARHDLVARSDGNAMGEYLRKHFTAGEVAAMGGNVHHYGYGVEQVVSRATSVGWVEAFLADDAPPRHSPALAHKDLPKWLNVKPAKPAPVDDPDVAKALVRHLMESPAPIPFEELTDRWSDVPRAALGGAILRGIARLVLFPTMRQQDMTPMLGLWPTVCSRLHRPRLVAPEPVKPRETFHGAFLLEDMTAMLVAATVQPLRLRGNDAALFAKVERELQRDLMSLPPWIAKLRDFSASERLRVAMSWLKLIGFAKQTGVHGEDLRMVATDRGRRWLAESAKGRLKAVFDYFMRPNETPRLSVARIDDDDLDDDDDFDWDDLDDDGDDGDDGDIDVYGRCRWTMQFLPFQLPVVGVDKYDEELRTALASAVTALSDKAFVPLVEFLRWQAQEKNPLPSLFSGAGGPKIHTGWSQRPATIEELEKLWRESLWQILAYRLLPFGCIRLAEIEGSDGVGIAIAGPGRYLFGGADDFDYGHDHDAQNQIVVQPNFDIVFLAPSPLAEASVGRFAERKARGVGTLFAVTKKSILDAAGSGMTSSQMLDTLARLSAKPVPANVAREIMGWFDQCRHVKIRSAVLIHCPDAATAARVATAGGKRADLLTDTVVELTDLRAKSELLRKLHGLGIFSNRLVQT